MKTIDVPWNMFVIMYVCFLLFMAFGSYIFANYFAVTVKYLVMANILFFVAESCVLLMIFLYAVKQEEVTDTRTLARLVNSIANKFKKSSD